MLNYRVQTCIDSTTYEALQKYMEKKEYETISIALRKIICKVVLDEIYENAVERGDLVKL